MKIGKNERKDEKARRPRGRARATMSEAESSDAPARKVRTRKDEPENHTRLEGGKKGHVTY